MKVGAVASVDAKLPALNLWVGKFSKTAGSTDRINVDKCAAAVDFRTQVAFIFSLNQWVFSVNTRRVLSSTLDQKGSLFYLQAGSYAVFQTVQVPVHQTYCQLFNIDLSSTLGVELDKDRGAMSGTDQWKPQPLYASLIELTYSLYSFTV